MRKTILLLTAAVLILTSCMKNDNTTPTFSINREVMTFLPDGNAVDNSIIRVATNMDWVASSDKEWCTVNQTYGTGSANISINLSPYGEYDNARTATITVRLTSGEVAKIVRITQEPQDHWITISDDALDFNHVGTPVDGNSFNVSSSTSWKIEYEDDTDKLWCAVTPTSGSKNATISINPSTSRSDETRSATLIVKIGNEERLLTVTQDGSPFNVLGNIADSKFKDFCKTFDTNQNGTLSLEESDNITVINATAKGLSSVAGIEYFHNLKELYCNDNSLAVLNTAQNQKLAKLVCDNNRLTTLNVSQNKELIELSCSNNLFTSLNLSQNAKLLTLDCSNNSKISTLDVNLNKKLESLNCSNNNMQTLDVSNNTGLKLLNINNDKNRFTLYVWTGFDFHEPSNSIPSFFYNAETTTIVDRNGGRYE